MIGTDVANYHVVEVLGEGGMGVVYKAIDVNLERTVAVKVLSPELSRDPGLMERFQAEAKAQASLNHTNIATLYNFLSVDGNWLIVMEYVEGENFEQLILRSGVMQAQDAVPLFKQALAGIGFAHRFGIVHRDIKPANIMVNRHGIVKVMDFGIAKALSGRRLTRTGVAVGTVAYMSPEQIRNQGIDMRTDIYSLGVTLYQMLTAHLPFDSESDFQVQYDHVNTPPPALTAHYPYIPPGIEAAVLKSMEKDPANRFRTVEEFAAALEDPDVVHAKPWVQGASPASPSRPTAQPPNFPTTPAGTAAATAARPATQPPRAATMVEQPLIPVAPAPVPKAGFWGSRNGRIAGIGALALVAVLGFGIWKWSQGKEATPQTNSTQVSNPPAANTTQTTQSTLPGSQPNPTPTAPPSAKPETTQHEQTAANTPPPKVEEVPKERTPKITKPEKPSTPMPAQPDPGTLALQKSQQLYIAQQLLNPANNCALYWAIQATAAGNAQGPDMERRIQSQIHGQFADLLHAKSFPMASNLINEIERFYQPGTFQSWRTELQNDQQAAIAAAQPKPAAPATPTTTTASAAGSHTYRVQHRHVNRVNLFMKVNNDPDLWFYNGTLTVASDGTVTFRCASVSIPQKACEADIEIAANDIKQVKAGDVLHIATNDRGNFDFQADGNTMAAIRNEITAAKKK